MGVVGKLETETDIKSSGDLFHELFGNNPHTVSTIIPHLIQDCKLHEGEYGTHGSIIAWHYTHLDGKEHVAKCEIEKVEEKKMITFKIVGGDYYNDDKKFTASVQLIRKRVKKMKDDGPYTTDLMDFWISITKDIDTHHLTA